MRTLDNNVSVDFRPEQEQGLGSDGFGDRIANSFAFRGLD
ncbi:hypothetical protein M2275_006934 [Rhodococcus opacus]|nr:hypothetical protein [Rhodococcus opacus]